MARLIKSIILFCFLPLAAWAKELAPEEIDDIVGEAMRVFSVPGMAVGIMQDGEVIHSKGYGITALENGSPVDEHTYFGIASNSKGFTSVALAILVDEGKISWDDPVLKYLPDFEVWDPAVTAEFTIRDLLAHATGLPLGSGDLMWWPDANFSPQEVIRNIRHLKPDRAFRTTYAYNNMPFIVAGEIIPAVTGKSYVEFLQERIFDPLGMDRCTASTPTMANDNNLAEPHAVIEGNLRQIKRYLILDEVVGSMAAAGIQCSVDDLLIWADMHINDGKGLMSAETHATLWQVTTKMNVSDQQRSRDKMTYRGYGLGYNLNDYHGVDIISHGGALIGMYSHISMLPELDVAVVITTNQQSGSAWNYIKNKVIDHILKVSNTSTAAALYERTDLKRIEEFDRVDHIKGEATVVMPTKPLNYTGPYEDSWWGTVDILYSNNEGFRFVSRRSPSLKGKLEHFEDNTFIVRWDDRTHEADAFVYFSMNAKSEITGFTMKAISNRTDFSYDFHHVNMTKK